MGCGYNSKKSELLVFRAKQFIYLAHVINEDLSDDLVIERERRAWSVRCNMLARRMGMSRSHYSSLEFLHVRPVGKVYAEGLQRPTRPV